MATIPNKIEKFYEAEKDEFTSIAQANWQKAAALLEYLNRSYPIGMLMFMHNSQDALPSTPDPKYWKFCDGTAVVNTSSPLNGVVIPDLRDKFVRHPKTGQAVLSTGGADTVNLNHNHGGLTGYGFDAGGLTSKNGSDGWRQPVGYHRHTIGAAMGSVATTPPFRYLQVYIRIA